MEQKTWSVHFDMESAKKAVQNLEKAVFCLSFPSDSELKA
jgi:hypothetical protein